MEEHRQPGEMSGAGAKPNWLVGLRGEWEAEPLAHAWQQSFFTAFAAVVALVLADALHLTDPYWAAISVVVVMQPEAILTITASRDRFLGRGLGGRA
jgi:uncharacterized membrane protein YccC